MRLFFTIIFLFISQVLLAQKVSGTLYFTDDTSLRFTHIGYLNMKCSTGTGGGTYYPSKEILVAYNNTDRKIPFSKLKFIEITELAGIKKARDYEIYYIDQPTINIKTKTNVEFKTSCKLMTSVTVTIHDELTGEYLDQRINFVKEKNKLNIKRIEFD